MCSLELPDLGQRFWQRYRDRGLTVVALNAHDDLEQIDQVQRFIDKIGVPYDVEFETSGTYHAIAQDFAGLNPFPVDVIVDRDGRIVHIQREYDSDAIAEVLERLLAE